MDEQLKTNKRNLIFYPLGTIGRDAIYQLFTNFILLFILYTRKLTGAQLGVITLVMVLARVFDAINDPVMGYIIEKTKTKFGKFKPWLALGVLLTGAVIIVIFNSQLEGWPFVIEFAIIYFMYSITYTMNDISYWGMVPALSSDAEMRNKLTSRAILFAGIGGTLTSLLIPMLTTGSGAIGGNARTAYGVIAIVIAILAALFICFTLFGVKERENQTATVSEKTGVKELFQTIIKNKPLLWIVVAFLLQQIGNGIVIGGIGSTYIYFMYGYDGSKYSLFSTVGVAATAILMVGYPAISKKFNRKKLMTIMFLTSIGGYLLMLLAGLAFPVGGFQFWSLTIGYMLSNFGQYGFYLVMMISILNTVEYNEYISGRRQEAIIASIRPFLTKMASALIVGVTYLTYMMLNVTDITNKISEFEQQANQNIINAEEKTNLIAQALTGVTGTQSIGLLIAMTIVPFVFMALAYFIYQRKYTLDENEYDRICKELEERRANK